MFPAWCICCCYIRKFFVSNSHPESYRSSQKCIRIALPKFKFQKIFWGGMPPHPPSCLVELPCQMPGSNPGMSVISATMRDRYNRSDRSNLQDRCSRSILCFSAIICKPGFTRATTLPASIATVTGFPVWWYWTTLYFRDCRCNLIRNKKSRDRKLAMIKTALWSRYQQTNQEIQRTGQCCFKFMSR